MRRILIPLAALGLAACAPIGDSSVPIPTELIRAPQPSALRTLVIVLPGRHDEGRGENERGMARTIQEAWPGADVLLASATFAYYRDGKVVQRLHEDIVAPAQRDGYRRIWLAGASMGGMGALLYERAHPGTAAGVVLFAPFLGDKALIDEIRSAGGIQRWQPGPLPTQVACGSDDFLLSASRLLATALPDGRFVELPGGHDWRTWSHIGKFVFTQIRTLEPPTL